MNIIEISFLGVVQGITEWLPVSSSGHLVLFTQWLNIQDSSLAFDIFLHVASLAVIIFFFRKQIIEAIENSLNKRHKNKDKKDWLWYIALSSLVTAVVGLIFYRYMGAFRNSASVSDWLLVTSILLLATKFSKEHKNIGWGHALVLGLAQGFGVLPGLSRSGVVIAVALIMGVKKKQAFEYAFIMAIPAILGSFILSLGDFNWQWVYLIGFALTVVVSYLTLNLLRIIINRNYFYLFFIYTLLLALIIKTL
ncbi:undecaprenyl-diphosphate phosphatase [Candidatus Parcubacteria bacterium]|jgi:undecaprenyl-diphosphatase|nr:undecaprenyl-diphosphate phosphatase [Candidatus Parcubacteria bacterium]